MNDLKEFIESGILEMYVLANASPEEILLVEQMAAVHEEVRNEIVEISKAVEKYAELHAEEPDPVAKIFIIATIDYMARMKNGETPSLPPVLHTGSKIADYAEWLNRKDLELTEPLEYAEARIIGYTPEATTAIIWLKYGAPPEMHTDEMEKVLVVEGNCEIIIGGEVNVMAPGDVLMIPLFKSHHVKVTSDFPCKIILQRAAA
ncbi:MAG: cupin domain-containing protein [Taibaiella sp.]|nr:cupin domain-containing protein [Taibaiella sp.]